MAFVVCLPGKMLNVYLFYTDVAPVENKLGDGEISFGSGTAARALGVVPEGMGRLLERKAQSSKIWRS